MVLSSSKKSLISGLNNQDLTFWKKHGVTWLLKTFFSGYACNVVGPYTAQLCPVQLVCWSYSKAILTLASLMTYFFDHMTHFVFNSCPFKQCNHKIIEICVVQCTWANLFVEHSNELQRHYSIIIWINVYYSSYHLRKIKRFVSYPAFGGLKCFWRHFAK